MSGVMSTAPKPAFSSPSPAQSNVRATIRFMDPPRGMSGTASEGSFLHQHEGGELAAHRNRDRPALDLALEDGLAVEVLGIEEPETLAGLQEGRDLEGDLRCLRAVVDRDMGASGIVLVGDQDRF